MERGVEAGHVRRAGRRPAGRFDRGDAPGLVERRQRRQLPQPGDHRIVDDDRPGERGTAVHDAVPDRVDRGHPRDELADGRVVAVPVGQVVLVEDRVRGVEDRQLERARTGVDDQQRHELPVHFQSRTSGRSSPIARV